MKTKSMDFIAPASSHTKFNWRVRSLASDFILEDTWEFPYEFSAEDGVDLHLFQKNSIEPVMKDIYDGSLTGILFRVRKVFGALFHIDDNLNNFPIPGCREKSLRDRLQESDLEKDMPERAMDISTRDYMSFSPVYTFADETLHEISNSTEHALMHYAWSPSGEGKWKVRLAVYVKHRTAFSAFYMSCIRPFRHFVVYPHIFRKCMEIWEAQKVSKSFLG
jgi:hypothetical protein